MTLSVVIILYVLVDLFVLNAFIEQRAALDIGRKIGRDVRYLVLPKWYAKHWVAKVFCWGTLLYIGFRYSWPIALGLWVADLLITALIPIPRSRYDKVIRKLKALGIME